MSYNIARNGSLIPIAGNPMPIASDPNIADEEFSPAQSAHSAGDYLYYDGSLYKAKTAIAVNDALVINTNIEQVNIGEELENKISKSDIQYAEITLLASGWSSGEYSLESLYPSSTYDIENVTTYEDSTAAMREAWNKADCNGYVSTNKIIAHGTVPSIDIDVIVKVIKK